jgi:hypothetical protein
MPRPQSINVTLTPTTTRTETKSGLPVIFTITGLPPEVAGVAKGQGGTWICYGARVAPKGMSLAMWDQMQTQNQLLEALQRKLEALGG